MTMPQQIKIDSHVHTLASLKRELEESLKELESEVSLNVDDSESDFRLDPTVLVAIIGGSTAVLVQRVYLVVTHLDLLTNFLAVLVEGEI